MSSVASKSMETSVFGKWILAGEHAVLRGCPALVFPVQSRRLDLHYIPQDADLSVELSGAHGAELQLLFWGVMERALSMTGRSRRDVRGVFKIRSEIPVGSGLGASAALCVALGRWCATQGWVETEALPEFCRQLENLFHGESSGVDIAVALSGRGLRYVRGGERSAVEVGWQPNWFISYSGKRGVTSECVSRVKSLWQSDSGIGEKIDLDMKEAVEQAELALRQPSAAEGFEILAEAINKARSCFERWGLATGEIGQHMQMLVDQGAYAVKPTGSGDGGYVLSLWQGRPPAGLQDRLIPLSVL